MDLIVLSFVVFKRAEAKVVLKRSDFIRSDDSSFRLQHCTLRMHEVMRADVEDDTDRTRMVPPAACVLPHSWPKNGR